MSANTFNDAFDFVPQAKTESRGIFGAIVSAFAALYQGIEVANTYQVLTEKGFAPADAARIAFQSAGVKA